MRNNAQTDQQWKQCTNRSTMRNKIRQINNGKQCTNRSTMRNNAQTDKQWKTMFKQINKKKRCNNRSTMRKNVSTMRNNAQTNQQRETMYQQWETVHKQINKEKQWINRSMHRIIIIIILDGLEGDARILARDANNIARVEKKPSNNIIIYIGLCLFTNILSVYKQRVRSARMRRAIIVGKYRGHILLPGQ